MLPQKPPHPTWRYLPFQPDSGIHTSNWMCESLVGVANAATRQKSGRFVIGVEEPGGVNDPPVTDSAVVIVVLGSVRFAKFEQESAAAVGAVKPMAASRPIQHNMSFIDRDLLLAECCRFCVIASRSFKFELLSGPRRTTSCSVALRCIS